MAETSIRVIKAFAGLVTIVALLAGAAVPAAAQSFSCRTTNNCTEAVICATPQLGRLDERMADRYFELKRLSARREARDLLASQREWLSDRNSCGCNANCLISYYRERIKLFDRLLDE